MNTNRKQPGNFSKRATGPDLNDPFDPTNATRNYMRKREEDEDGAVGADKTQDQNMLQHSQAQSDAATFSN